MKKISIVGVEGSGKTVLMSVLGDKYSVPDENGFFLNPLNRETFEYCVKTVADMRKGYWPQVTEPGQMVKLQWNLCRAKENRTTENLGEVTMMDFAGEVYRAAFGGKNVQESFKKDVESLQAYVLGCEKLLLLINLKDIIDGDESEERTIDMLWASKSIMDYAIENGVNDIAIAFTQSEQYSSIIAECGGPHGTLKKYHGLIAALYPMVNVIALSAVRDTVINDNASEVPSQDFCSVGLDKLVRWMAEEEMDKSSVHSDQKLDDSNMLSEVKKVQLWEGGPYWADRNIGAEKPEDYGYYFWWGDTVGYKRVNDKWVASDGSNSNFSLDGETTPTFCKSISDLHNQGWIIDKNGVNVLTPKYDAASAYWGEDWRMPTKQELEDLSNKCEWTWTTRNGVNGYVVRGKGSYSSAEIFLPSAGSGYGTSLNYTGSDGGYWSSVPNSDDNRAWRLYFTSGGHCTYYNYRYYGQSVRPLQGFTK